MSLKLLLWFLVLGWIYHRWASRKRHSSFLFRAPPEGRPFGTSQAEASGEEATQEMVQCAHCGVYLPREEALSYGSRWYCGVLHRQAGPRSVE
jgi:hypothetical protein